MSKRGPQKTNFEAMPARFPKGTFQRIDGARKEGENRSDFVRIAVEREISRRIQGCECPSGEAAGLPA